jgi:RNA recognition motif-containing protein
LNDVGYQVSYAKESLASQLKRLQDNRTTNIYLSNLPVSMDESELIRICEEACDGGKVMSTRILRTEDGVSRGVGFARMDNRNNALLVIERLNGAIISG